MTIWQDVRHGARGLIKARATSLTAILSIALGVGANAAMFSVADALALRPPQVPRPGELVAITGTTPTGPGSPVMSYPDYLDVRTQSTSFTGVIAYRVVITGLAADSSEPPRTKLGLAVSANFFEGLEVPPALGRGFLPGEERPGAAPVAILAYETWRNEFAADARILERRIRLGGTDFTVVGIAPAAFEGMNVVLPPAFYVPIGMLPALDPAATGTLDNRGARQFSVKARLTPDVPLTQATAEMRTVGKNLEAAYPATNTGRGLLVQSDFDARVAERSFAVPLAAMLMSLAVVLLLVACANVAGLFQSRLPVRHREMALRLALGGSRLLLIRQLLVESALVAAASAVAGIGVAYAIIASFRAQLIVSDIGVRASYSLDRRVLIVGLTAAASSALLAGVLPAWQATRTPSLTDVLKGSVPARRRSWGRHTLLTLQVAMALVILTLATSFYRTLQMELSRPGFRTEGLLLVGLDPSLARYD